MLLGLLLGGTLGVVTDRGGAQLAAAHPQPAPAAGPGAPAPTVPPATHDPGSPTGAGQPTASRAQAVEHKGQKREHGKHKHPNPDKGNGHKAAGD